MPNLSCPYLHTFCRHRFFYSGIFRRAELYRGWACLWKGYLLQFAGALNKAGLSLTEDVS